MSDKIDSRQFSVEEICRFYGVSLDKVQRLTRSIEWVRDGLTPWAQRLEQEASE